jgi:hypothetical protein
MIATLATSQKWLHRKIEEKKTLNPKPTTLASAAAPSKTKTQRKKKNKKNNTRPVHQVLTKLLCAHHPRAPVGLLMRFFFQSPTQ